jgi:hypothetical protein
MLFDELDELLKLEELNDELELELDELELYA